MQRYVGLLSLSFSQGNCRLAGTPRFLRQGVERRPLLISPLFASQGEKGLLPLGQQEGLTESYVRLSSLTLEIGHFLGSPPEIRRGSAAQRRGGGLRQAPKTTIQALRTEFENCGHEPRGWSFPQLRIAPPRHWLRQCLPLLSRGGDSKRPIFSVRLSSLTRRRSNSATAATLTANGNSRLDCENANRRVFTV